MNAFVNSTGLQIAVLCVFAVVTTVSFLQINWQERYLRTNAYGAKIPYCFGVVPAILLTLDLSLFYPIVQKSCLVVIGFSIIGLLDDILGTSEYRGLRGHLRALRSGKITTGFVKLVASPMLAGMFAVSAYGFTSWMTYLSIITVAATSNLFNLLDLRPGRSQGFGIVTLVVLLLFYRSPLVLGGILVLLVTIIPDSRAIVMMGDSGAIAIGAAIGLMFIASSNITLIIGYTVIAVLLNLLAEKYSLGKLISDSAFLSKVDRCFGRRS